MEKEQLQKALDSIHSEDLKTSLKMQNIETAAKFNGWKVDWENGKII